MPSYNLTIADVSPLWTYSGRWDAVDDGDVFANSTLHTAKEKGANATLAFNGTAFYVFGGANDIYSVTLDNQTFPLSRVTSLTNETQPLFSRAGLKPGPHKVILTREGAASLNGSLDLSHAIITLGDGESSHHAVDKILGDDAPEAIYDENWTTENGTNQETKFSRNQHVHNTTRLGATVKIPFRGNAITVFGGLGSSHGTYTIALDGGDHLALSGRAPQFHAQQILFEASDLDPAESHTLSITTASEAPFDLDYVVVSDWGRSTNAGAISGAIAGAVAGGVLGGVLLLIGLGILIGYLVWRNRRKHAVRANPESSQEMGQAGPPGIQPYVVTTAHPTRKQDGANPENPFADPVGPSFEASAFTARTIDGTFGGSATASLPPDYDQVVNSARTTRPPAAAGNIQGLRIVDKRPRGG